MCAFFLNGNGGLPVIHLPLDFELVDEWSEIDNIWSVQNDEKK